MDNYSVPPGSQMPEKKRLTDAIVKTATLPPGKAEAVLVGFRSHGLRLAPSATKQELYLGLPARRRRPIVQYEAVEARDARHDCERLRGPQARACRFGSHSCRADPAAERAEQKRRLKSRVLDLVERYDAELERRGYVNRKTVMSGLRARLAPHLNRELGEVTGADLAAIIEALEGTARAARPKTSGHAAAPSLLGASQRRRSLS